jgi:hypothetical protein
VVRHLHLVSGQHASTGMTARNLAIVWAPNLVRPPPALQPACLSEASLRDIGAQARLVEALVQVLVLVVQ